jgi:uncharacterized protein YodC (DUF2158 family)
MEPETGWHLWRLREGDQVRIVEGGPEVTITRVSESAAYYKTFQENTFEVFDTELGEHKEITKRSSKVFYIAPRSFVEMIERGPRPTRTSEWGPAHEEAETPTPKPPKPRPELSPVKYKKVRRRR